MEPPPTRLEFFDSHTHLDFTEFDEERERILNRALEAGVTRLLTVGAGRGVLDSARAAVNLALMCAEAEAGRDRGIVKPAKESREDWKFPRIWASVGIHPLGVARIAAAGLREEALFAELEALAALSQVVAIGETGIDLFRSSDNRAHQERIFRAQVALAIRLKKPLIIHSRSPVGNPEAGQLCLAILREMEASQVGGVFHCFGENAEFAAKLAEISFVVSFPGILTFRNAKLLQAAASEIPLEQILIETDAPYLAPEPFRGQRCESAMVVKTAEALAAIKGVSLAEVAAATTANACRLFRVP